MKRLILLIIPICFSFIGIGQNFEYVNLQINDCDFFITKSGDTILNSGTYTDTVFYSTTPFFRVDSPQNIAGYYQFTYADTSYSWTSITDITNPLNFITSAQELRSFTTVLYSCPPSKKTKSILDISIFFNI